MKFLSRKGKMRKIFLIISLSILPFTCFGASGNCEWLPYSTMGTAAGGAAASSNGGLLLSTASSSSTSGGLFCDWVNVDEKEKIQFIVYNHDVLMEDISKGSGENLNALSTLYNCTAEAQDDFTKMMRNSFIQKNELYYNSKLNYKNTQKMMREIRKNIQNSEVLRNNCLIG